MGFVTLPLDIGPKLAVNNLAIKFAWGDIAGGRNFVFCLILVVIFIRLRRAYRLGGEFLKLSSSGQATKGWDHFYQGG